MLVIWNSVLSLPRDLITLRDKASRVEMDPSASLIILRKKLNLTLAHIYIMMLLFFSNLIGQFEGTDSHSSPPFRSPQLR